jgi:hypothetical protein
VCAVHSVCARRRPHDHEQVQERDLTQGLTKRYGEISLRRGPVINNLGMVLDFTHAGQVVVTMSSYTDDVLNSSGTPGTARTPGTDCLFEVRNSAPQVPEDVRVWFRKHVAMILYLAKRARPELLTAVLYRATRVTKCDGDDVDKLIHFIRHIRGTCHMGRILRPGASGIRVHLFVDASYGVHVDGRSHTGSCVVIGDQIWWDYRTQRIRGSSFGTSCDYRGTACRQS